MDMEETEEVILRLPEDVHKLCRTCLTVSSEKMSLCHDILIFNEFNILTEVAEMLQSCSAIKIKPEEGLPMSICDDCASKLEIAYNFKHQCEKTDASLRKLMEMPPTDYEKSGSIIKEEFTENINKETGVVLYEYNIHKNEEIEIDIGQVDLSQLFEQRESLIAKYISNEEVEIPKPHLTKKQSDIFEMIQERKTYTTNEEFEEKTFVDDLKPSKNELETNIQSDKNKEIDDRIFSYSEEYKKIKVEENDDSGENFPPYECHVCSKTFKTKYARKLHVATHTRTEEGSSTKSYSCDLCNKTFRTEPKLAAHFYNHAKIAGKELETQDNSQITTCSFCAEIFTSSNDLDDHVNTQHKKDGKVTCEICSLEFDGEANLIYHLKKHGIQITFCKICLKRFNSPHKLRFHQRLHLVEKSKTVFKCPICKDEFNSPDLLKEHSVDHLNEAYRCDKCKRTFNNAISYEFHVRQHTEAKFLCSICGKQYFNSVTLACHVRTHSNEKPFVCAHCNKAFSSRATLSVHKRIHSSFKPYVCSYCGYSCRQSGDLAMHIRTHTGDKPYKCTFPNCERRFTTSSQRKEHYRRHTNERNHKCKNCGKAFLESKTLKVHMLTHTGEKPHCCEICGKKFRRSHHLSNHIKGHINYTAATEEIQIFEMANVI